MYSCQLVICRLLVSVATRGHDNKGSSSLLFQLEAQALKSMSFYPKIWRLPPRSWFCTLSSDLDEPLHIPFHRFSYAKAIDLRNRLNVHLRAAVSGCASASLMALTVV